MSISTDNIIDSYFDRKNILVKHQIESFDNLIDNIIPNIFSQFFPIELEFSDNIIKKISLKITNINVGQPFSTENNGCSKFNQILCKKINLMPPLYVNFGSEITICEMMYLKYLKRKNNNITFEKLLLIQNIVFWIIRDLMKCKYDLGGYSIINGNEKVIISKKELQIVAQVFKSKVLIKIFASCEIRALHENYSIPKVVS